MLKLRFALAGLVATCAVGSLAHCGSSKPTPFTPQDAATDGDDATTDDSGDDSPGPPLFDAAGDRDAPIVVDKCHVPPDNQGGNAPLCTKSSPPNSFMPKVKWQWSAPPPMGGTGFNIEGSIVTPLVAEMVDTDHNGEVNLCDIPSVIVTTSGGGPAAQGNIYMLAGDTGKVQATFDGYVDASVNPALGDIDGDGVSEVIADDIAGHLVAYDNKGHVKWTGPDIGQYKQQENSYCHAIAIHDLDGDGKPEIIAAFEVFDNKGHHKFAYDESAFANEYWCPANTAADLDGDGKLEVIFGNAALHWDGSTYWTIPGPPGMPQVGDFDGNGVPELFVARQDGLMIISHDGKVLAGPIQSFDPVTSPNCWSKAGAVGDFDGSGHASIMDGSCNHFGIWHVQPSALQLQWSAAIDDTSGVASSTAFDFLGRGIHDAVYGDQDNLWVYNGKTGMLEFSSTRSSGTLIEYPVVADTDNDGSADIVVVSNKSGDMPQNYTNTVQVLEDAQKRWIPSRRIWNQHAYYVTNVREDGTIPAKVVPNWKLLNTFRVNSQIENGADCAPPMPK